GKHELSEKCTGVFPHYLNYPRFILVRGFNDIFYAPHSRYTTVLEEDIKQHPDLLLVSQDRKSTRLNSSHVSISYAVFCLKKKIVNIKHTYTRKQHNDGTDIM